MIKYNRFQSLLSEIVLMIGEPLSGSLYVATLVFITIFYLVTPRISLSGAIYSWTRPMAPGLVNWIYLMVMLSLYLILWVLFALMRARLVSDPIDWYRFLPDSALGGLDFILMALILMTIILLVIRALGLLTIELPYEPVLFLDGIVAAAIMVHNREEASYGAQEEAERHRRIRRMRQIRADLQAKRREELRRIEREIENLQRKYRGELNKLDTTITRLRARRDAEREALKRDVLRLEGDLRRASLELEQVSQALEADTERMAKIQSLVGQVRSLEQKVARLQDGLSRLQAEHRSRQEKWPGERTQLETRIREFERERDERVKMEEDRAEELRSKMAEPDIPEAKKARLEAEWDKLETWLAGKTPHQTRVARLEKKIEKLTEQLEAGEEEWLAETTRLEGEIGRLTIEGEKQEQSYRIEDLRLEQEVDRLLAEWAPKTRPSLWRRIWAAIVRFVRRLLRRPEVTPDVWEKVDRLMTAWRERRQTLETRLAALRVEIQELPERRAERERLGKAKIEELEREIAQAEEQREECKQQGKNKLEPLDQRRSVLALTDPLSAATPKPMEMWFVERPYDRDALARPGQIQMRILRPESLSDEAPREYRYEVAGEVEDEFTLYDISEQFQTLSRLRGYCDVETITLAKTFADKSETHSLRDDPEGPPLDPVEVLDKGKGNVQSRTRLARALLCHLGFEVELFFYASPEHWVLGIEGADGLPGSFITHRGRQWYYCEVDSTEPVGEVPERYTRLRFTPLPEGKWRQSLGSGSVLRLTTETSGPSASSLEGKSEEIEHAT